MKVQGIIFERPARLARDTGIRLSTLGGRVVPIMTDGTTRPMAVELDDPEDLENTIIRASIRNAPSFRIGKMDYVIWHGILPPRWRSQLHALNSQQSALEFLMIAEHGGLSATKQRALAVKLHAVDPQMSKDDVRILVASELVTGDLWAIRRNAHIDKGKADIAVFQAVNTEFGTNIDFNFLAKWEGGQYLHGYIPFRKGVVVGKSGMTIATGFDIGQKSQLEIKHLKLALDLEALLMPFADQRFKGKTRAEVITIIANTIRAPVPKINKEQGNLLDKLIHAEHVAATISAWNAERKPGVPMFIQLPEAWQTVMFSRFFHLGKSVHLLGVFQKFWQAAIKGDWEVAIAELRSMPLQDYRARFNEEANHLKSQLPPPVLQVKPPSKPAVKKILLKALQVPKA